MAYDFYQSAALLLRYGFTVAGLFVAGRGAYMTLRDGRRARGLRADARETGALAVLDVVTPDGQTRKIRIGREGVAGGGRVCDVRVPQAGLRRRHFSYEIVGGRLRVIALEDAVIRTVSGVACPELMLHPGERFVAGKARLRFHVMRVRTAPISPCARRVYGKTMHRAVMRRTGAERRLHGKT